MWDRLRGKIRSEAKSNSQFPVSSVGVCFAFSFLTFSTLNSAKCLIQRLGKDKLRITNKAPNRISASLNTPFSFAADRTMLNSTVEDVKTRCESAFPDYTTGTRPQLNNNPFVNWNLSLRILPAQVGLPAVLASDPTGRRSKPILPVRLRVRQEKARF